MEIVGSCQNLDALQMVASVALGVPMNKVTASVKRLGWPVYMYMIHNYNIPWRSKEFGHPRNLHLNMHDYSLKHLVYSY